MSSVHYKIEPSEYKEIAGMLHSDNFFGVVLQE